MTIRTLRLALLAAVLALLAGCAGTVTNMREIPVAQAPTAPDAGMAMLVFLRPSGLGFGVQSTVYEIRNDEPVLIGIVAAKTRVAHQVRPGKYLFMTIGENADFMSAEVQAGRTYYVKVEPRMGAWKARFGLEPYRLKDLGGQPFVGELAECKPIVKIPESDAWAAANMTSIRQKRSEYYGEWVKQPEAARPHLRAEDGR
jgi:hypothetical protein